MTANMHAHLLETTFSTVSYYISGVPGLSKLLVGKKDDSYKEILETLKADFQKCWDAKKPAKKDRSSFKVFNTLGTGSFGRVVLVQEKATGTFYAMKVLSKEQIVKTKQIDHILNEKHILSCVKYPFMVYMNYAFIDNTYLYFVMPFVNGGEMFTYLKKFSRFDEELARFYGAQVLLGLEYLHYLDLVYRDLKPENILIDSEGYLKITDFGFAKLINGRTWTFCGTPEYLAPEIILTKGYGKAVDWWSYGVLLYEMVAGYPPFFANDQMKIFEKIVAGTVKYPNVFSMDLIDLIKNLLQVDLTRRFGNLKNGAADIKSHRWFSHINYLELYYRRTRPPFKPKVKGENDASNFDKFEEEAIDEGKADVYKEYFKNF